MSPAPPDNCSLPVELVIVSASIQTLWHGSVLMMTVHVGVQLQISRPSSQGAKGGISSVSVADTFAAAGSANGSVRVWDIRCARGMHICTCSHIMGGVGSSRHCQGLRTSSSVVTVRQWLQKAILWADGGRMA